MINLTADGNSTVDIAQGAGGDYFLDVNGTFGGGSLAVQISNDRGTNYSPLTTAVGADLAITADYNAIVVLPQRAKVKFVLTGSTSPDLDINLVEV